MKIYILPYSNKTFFSYKKRISGIDVAALTQLQILRELGHDVRMFHAQGDLDQYMEGIDYYINYREENPKEFEKLNRKKIEKKLLESILKFNPDLIISNYEFSAFYSNLMNLEIPIAYVSHAMPGFWNDAINANLLYKMVSSGHSFSCVSEYHKQATIKYYRAGRTYWKWAWEFSEIIPDFIFFPQYCNKEEVKESTYTVKHCSGAQKAKDTFLIHEYLEGSNIPTEVYTTLTWVGSKELDPYVTDNIAKYKDNTYIDVDHSDIMNKISTAGTIFVGNCPDTFTITSLEALSRGVPLIVKEKMGGHPATEMVEPEFLKYIALIKNKKDFIENVQKFIMIPINERRALADSVYRKMGKDSYKNLITKVVNGTIEKYRNTSHKKTLEDFF